MISETVFDKKVEVSNYSPENPLAFFEIDHNDMGGQLDLEKDSLYFEGAILYHQRDNYGGLEIADKTGKQTSETMEYIEAHKALIKREEFARDDDKGKNSGILYYYHCSDLTVTQTIQKQMDRIFFKNTVAIFNQLSRKAYVVQQLEPNKIEYKVTVVKSKYSEPQTEATLEGVNRLLADIKQEDLGSGFTEDYHQIVIPRHINTMISYIYKGHNLKIMNKGRIVDIRETFKEMQLAMDFQTPILKYFYPLESDIVSGMNLNKSEKLFKDRKIIFSKNIVHFDGIKLESLDDIKKGEHHKFFYQDKEKTVLKSGSEPNEKPGEEKKDDSGRRVGDNNENQLKDSERHLIVTENVIFTHDDRSVRPVLLVKTEGEVFKESEIEKITLALFDFEKMTLAETKLDKRKLLTSIDLNIAFCPIDSSYRSISK